MRWPWRRKASSGHLIVSWSGQTLAYVQVKVDASSKFQIEKMGVERQSGDSMDIFLARLQSLNLQGGEVFFMLRPEQYQLLQIDAPSVAPEELRSAARYLIREMVESHLDDLTLDVMKVGDGQQKGAGSLYVVVATNVQVREVLELGETMRWPVSVIDIQETAQRNLQTALAMREGLGARANAALVVTSDRQAMLTICANDELFYSRRLDLPDSFLTMDWRGGAQADAAGSAGYMPVTEYVPDYAGTAGYGYGNEPTADAVPSGFGNDRAQRFLVEVHRSLDLWDRTWTGLPLASLRVEAGARSADMADWLAHELGQPVGTMDFSKIFSGLEDAAEDVRLNCLPLLGVLMRTASAKP